MSAACLLYQTCCILGQLLHRCKLLVLSTSALPALVITGCSRLARLVHPPSAWLIPGAALELERCSQMACLMLLPEAQPDGLLDAAAKRLSGLWCCVSADLVPQASARTTSAAG